MAEKESKKETTEIATAEPVTTALEKSSENREGFIINPDDIDIPWMNVVQRSSTMDTGSPGDLVHDKEHVMVGADTPLLVVPLTPKKGWKENIPFDSDETPRLAYSEHQRDLLAEDSDYELIEFAELGFLVPNPDANGSADFNPAYPFPIAGGQYNLGRIYVQKDAYRQTYKRLATFQTFNAEIPLNSIYWELSVVLMERGKYKWYAPSLKATEQQTPETLREFLSQWS